MLLIVAAFVVFLRYTMPFATIDDALHEYAAGRMIIVVDDENRENEGDLVCAAASITPAQIAFMAREGRGLICLALPAQRLDELQIPPMVRTNTAQHGTNFSVSIEAAHGVTTGISAHDRAHTIRTVLDPATTPADLARPGHVFPLRAAAAATNEPCAAWAKRLCRRPLAPSPRCPTPAPMIRAPA